MSYKQFDRELKSGVNNNRKVTLTDTKEENRKPLKTLDIFDFKDKETFEVRKSEINTQLRYSSNH